VYADALDESGEPSNAARAEFIRGQIALESLPEGNSEQIALAARCSELFQENWIDWWRPVCVAVGLPEPYVPTRRLRERVKRLVGREKRQPGAPYTAHSHAWSISSEEHGFTAQFIAGFPELLYFPPMNPDEGRTRLGGWASAIPLSRLRLSAFPAAFFSSEIDGPHLAKVSELRLDRLDAEVAAVVGQSPHLAGLKALKVQALNPTRDVVRELVYRPTWRGLRSLMFTGVIPPDAIQMLAERCTLEELETLSFGIREVPELFVGGGLTGVIGAMFNELLSRFFDGQPMPPGPIRWPDYWPALLALARSAVLPRLRTLQIIDAEQQMNRVDTFFQRFRSGQEHPPPASDLENLFPDTLIGALAVGLNPDRLVRLELPATRVALAGRAELLRLFGPRLVLA
jgi:hypothetical protein